MCVGNLDSEVKGCIQSLDFISLKVFFDRIMMHYDTNTGPLNSIVQAYHGQPKFLEGNDEHYNIIGRLDSNSCRYTRHIENMEPQEIREDSYCSNYCTLTKTCNAYKLYSKELTKEELERKAMELATLNAARRI